MVTTNIKEYSDEDIIALVNGSLSGDIPYTLSDLKKLLAEVTNRKLDTRYTNILTNLMKSEITGQKGIQSESFPRRQVSRESEPVFDDSFADENEKFPVLSFLSGLFKVVAWVSLVIFIASGAVIGFAYFKGLIMYAAASLLSGIMLGTIFLLFFYAQAEKILLKLEIERHLRRK